jgi:hypothetical protein
MVERGRVLVHYRDHAPLHDPMHPAFAWFGIDPPVGGPRVENHANGGCRAWRRGAILVCSPDLAAPVAAAGSRVGRHRLAPE